MRHYDFILAGGGLAGMSLAYRLIHGSLRDASILILDRDSKEGNGRTWCFWAPPGQPTLFDGIVSREWDWLQLCGDSWKKDSVLRNYRYRG